MNSMSPNPTQIEPQTPVAAPSPDVQKLIDQLVFFIQDAFKAQNKTKAVIGVSGGIDSAVSLTLLAKAIGIENITALLLPYGDQSTEDGKLIATHVGIPENQMIEVNIKPIVVCTIDVLKVPKEEAVRIGNLKARARMLCIFDTAKALDAMVCGTENKSEHFLGYFTRFGDAASDIEPISSLYKTQVRIIAAALGTPQVFLDKAPSAGLWSGQTDEEEMGFTYEQADLVLEQLIDQKKEPTQITVQGLDHSVVAKILNQVDSMKFKLHVPYQIV